MKRLVRTRIGPLQDTRLAPGEWRELAGEELRSLERIAWNSGTGWAGRGNYSR